MEAAQSRHCQQVMHGYHVLVVIQEDVKDLALKLGNVDVSAADAQVRAAQGQDALALDPAWEG